MGKLRVLFIGGTGVISSACVREAVAGGGIELTVLNRGESGRTLPPGVRELRADARAAIDRFQGRTGQYVFISPASAYQKPPSRLPITESTPLRNPFWQYSRDKIACEDLLTAEYRDNGFPATVVRPSHTYDATKTVLSGGWTSLARMRAGKAGV